VSRTSADEIRAAIDELKAFREAHRIDGLTLDEMRRDGRRY